MSQACAPPPPRLGPYELLGKLATGGMAEVYEARRLGPHGFAKRIALKRILPQLAADAEFVAMFIDEARLCATLSHPNLVEVFDFGDEGNELFIAMELVDGTTGAKVVRAAAARDETVPLEVALYIALSVARGLEHAHEACDADGRPLGLVHRDVSPGNMLISRAGAVKLGDFGIARARQIERRTEHGQLKGKLGYMSPEQVTGRELDHKSDQFTLAIALAEMLTAFPLFSGGADMDVLIRIRDADLGNLERHGDPIPPEVREVLFRALARRPEDRFPTTRAFADALDRIIRRRRLAADATVLARWLARVGLVSGKSGEYRLEDAETARGLKAPPKEARKISGPMPVSQPPAKRPSLVPRAAAPSFAPRGDSIPPHELAPSIYRALLPDGVVGPMPYARLVEIFATGNASASTPVSREAGPFLPARTFPELERLTTSIATRWDDSIDRGASNRWRISALEWPGQLFDLVYRRATGLLVVRDGARRKKVFFADGVPELALSVDRSELLGAVLVARGLALPMEVEMGVAVSPSYGGRLGDALVGMGVLRSMELARALVAQTRQCFVELVSWKKGEASFVEGARSHEETMPEAIPALELVAQGIREGFRSDQLTSVLLPMASSLLAPPVRSPVSPGSLKMTPAETAVVESLFEPRAVADVVADAVQRRVADREEAMRALFIAVSARMLVVAEWPAASVRQSQPTIPESA